MRVIGVIDLRGGQAVRAYGGRREDYEPIRIVGGVPVAAGHARSLADAYLNRFGLSELYVADLDAIEGQGSQDSIVADLAEGGTAVCVDAGVTTSSRAREVLSLGASAVVVGLETLSSFDALSEICRVVRGERVIFSLDLRDGQPLCSNAQVPGSEPAHAIAVRAANAGAQTVLVLDLARVGTGVGLDYLLLSRIRQELPRVALWAGGGVSDLDDLRRLADVGCDGALVASALQSGRLTASDITSMRDQPSGTR